jgi:3-deoxy-D-manno-octulosonic acid (KDO) 8-phosphate synthase
VRRDRTGTASAAGDLHHDLRSPSYRSRDLGNLPRRESVPPLRTRAAVAQDLQKGILVTAHANPYLTHCASPS